VSEDTPPNPVSGNVLGNDTDVDTLDTHSVTQVNGLGANVGNATAGTYGNVTIQFRRQLQLHAGQLQGLRAGARRGPIRHRHFTYTNADNHGATSSTTAHHHRPRHQ